ncbi:MAG: hypothetical protein EAZ27_12065 [Cytophagales bacterium]|nr:MAG: hypothetical protein EAZ27_12065 [Cytophagales bacterium]
MRKIDKTIFFATAFAEYIKEYAKNIGYHPVYDSSKNPYYNDVYYNLLFCQKGLCAYTEDLLENTIWKDIPNKWKNGKYIGETPKLDADLDHFNPLLRSNQGWDLDNLFVVKTYINRKIKLRKKVYHFFKPDNPNYSPEKYLEYNFLTHRFIPNSDLETIQQEKVDYMIETLGLNAFSTLESRRLYLSEIKFTMKNSFITFEVYKNEKLYKFFTAYEMSKFELEN